MLLLWNLREKVWIAQLPNVVFAHLISSGQVPQELDPTTKSWIINMDLTSERWTLQKTRCANTVVSRSHSYLLSKLVDRRRFKSFRETSMKPSLLEKNKTKQKHVTKYKDFQCTQLAMEAPIALSLMALPCSVPDYILVAGVLHTRVPLTPKTLGCELQDDRFRLPIGSYGGL